MPWNGDLTGQKPALGTREQDWARSRTVQVQQSLAAGKTSSVRCFWSLHFMEFALCAFPLGRVPCTEPKQ